MYGLDRNEFYSLDTMTRVTQCIKSVYTHTTDYCTIILADLVISIKFISEINSF